jgi:hypothetical protein
VVEYKTRVFCSDECCDSYEDSVVEDEPDLDQFSDEELAELAYEEVDFGDEEDLDDGLDDEYRDDAF